MGRLTESLRTGVTPRIINQEEEEERIFTSEANDSICLAPRRARPGPAGLAAAAASQQTLGRVHGGEIYADVRINVGHSEPASAETFSFFVGFPRGGGINTAISGDES